MKQLRGTVVDPFSFSAERRAERAAIAAYEADLAPWLAETRPERLDKVIAVAELPLQVRGFGRSRPARPPRQNCTGPNSWPACRPRHRRKRPNDRYGIVMWHR